MTSTDFRIDTLRYLQGNLPQLFGNSVREFALSIGKKNFFTFGEVLDSNEEEDIASFIGRNTTTGDDADSLVGVDAALDYPLFNVLTPTVKGFSRPVGGGRHVQPPQAGGAVHPQLARGCFTVFCHLPRQP